MRYQLKTPYRDVTTHVIFEPLDFMARLAALAPRALDLLAGWALPRPRVNLTHYHGVFAPNSPHRALVTKAGRGRGARGKASEEVEKDMPAARRAAMSWAQRLKRVFRIDVETCQAGGGAVKIIASIENPVVIGKILVHVGDTAPVRGVVRLPGSRAPRDVGFDEARARIHGFTRSGCRPGREEGRVGCGRRAGIQGRGCRFDGRFPS